MSITVYFVALFFLSQSLVALGGSSPSFVFMEITRRRVQERLQISSQLDYPFSVNGRDKVASTMEPSRTKGNWGLIMILINIIFNFFKV